MKKENLRKFILHLLFNFFMGIAMAIGFLISIMVMTTIQGWLLK